jgi:dephospho-CoA kinase
MIIGITGNIGSGKSTFSKFAEEAGFPVLKADDISKFILQTDEKVRNSVIKAFGNEAFNGLKPNKEFLAKEVFSDNHKLQKLESILHPKVVKHLNQKIKQLKKSNSTIFVEAALIYEADLEEMFDFIVLITSEQKLRMERKLKTGMKKEDFFLTDSNQISEEEKKKRADFIFSNNSTLEELHSKFKLLLLTLGLN